MSEITRYTILLLVIFGVIVSACFVSPIPQDLDYHQFADQSLLFGIPNFWNIVSNVPFFIVGIYALISLSKGEIVRYRSIGWIFFSAVVLTGFGSSYYHYALSNQSLVWDRLPMTISFMSFFAFIISEHINKKLGQWLLWPLLIVGVFSVIYWSYTENLGVGDLRLYGLVQFLPILLTPLVMIMFPDVGYNKKYIVVMITVYILAKLLEYFDMEILLLLGGISGHSLKHVVAAIAGIAFYLAIKDIRG